MVYSIFYYCSLLISIDLSSAA
ncbi:MAG: hypothetical protein CBD96_001755 [Gammaproteobacteria bacterium TMED236]|nr:MAG: hypothetical protein CBD96_001755 [Gammaproteobacteria bacterium TMED236]